MSEVFDADALFEEVKAKAVTVKFRGEEFDLPFPTLWPDGTLKAASDNDMEGAGRLILGDEQYDRWLALGGNSGFLQDIVKRTHGTTMGESSASSSS